MSLPEIWQRFIEGMAGSSWWERIAVFAGIASVWYSRKENILVYPVGLINTIIYVGLSLKGHLPGEAAVNFYYTVMSVYGWVLWARRDASDHQVLSIRYSDRRWWSYQFIFFLAFYLALFLCLIYLKTAFFPEAIPWADAFASASAFTGMWLMTKKKVESWYWWIITNIASIPLYFIKGYVFTSVYYLILLGMAFYGLTEWRKKATHYR